MSRRILERFPAVGASSRLNAFELAAIIYDDGVSIDHLMCFFADELQNGGQRLGGLVQLPSDEPAAELRLFDLAVRECVDLPTPSHSDRLADVRRRIGKAADPATALAFIPRFGEAEMAGGGLADSFGLVAVYGTPILTAVHRRHVNDWLTFTGGIGTLLACRLRVLRDWWTETDRRHRAVLARHRTGESAVDEQRIVRFVPSPS